MHLILLFVVLFVVIYWLEELIMLHKLSQKITDHYVKKNKIDDSERDIYEYCFEVLLSTF